MSHSSSQSSSSHSKDAESVESQCKCSLGINRKTGRLQWCPGFTCCKLFIIFPVIMLPITLVLVLLMRMDGMLMALRLTDPSTQSAEFENSVAVDYPVEEEGEVGGRVSRCTNVHFGLSETLDIEERDLLKDIRTSFIPPDFIVVPPGCVIDRPLGSPNTNEEYTEYDVLPHRQRRASNISEYSDEAEEEYETNEKSENSPIIQVAPFDQGKSGNTALGINGELGGAHLFWKSQGSRESIRKSQAETMMKYMDLTADPCMDFYQYACGNWEKLNPIPKDKVGYDTFEMLRESLDLVLRELLLEERPKKHVVAVDNNLYPKSTPDGKATDIDLERNSDETVLKARLRKHIIEKRDVFFKVLKEYQRTGQIRRRRRHLAKKLETHKKAVVVLEVDAEQKARYLYQSCVNSQQLEKRGIEPLLNLLDSLGGWPVLDPDWSEDQFDWLNLTANLRLYNNDILIVEWIGPDIKNSDENIIQLDQTTLGLPTRDYFLQDVNLKYLSAYKEFMKTVMELLGAPANLAATTAQDMIDFETELAKITSSSEDRANISVLYTRINIRELCLKVPGIDWLRYLSIVQDRQVDPAETVVIYATRYMESLVSLLDKSDPKLVANYLMWRFVRHRINNVDDRFLDTKQTFFNVLFGREQNPPRWKNCVGQVNANMGMALGAMFVRKYFDENSKEDTLKMTHDLQNAFRDILSTTDWLDKSTRHLAELKVNAMSLKIGYPDFILSTDQLNAKYEGLAIEPDKYFENTLNVLRHTTYIEQQKLHEAVNKTAWQTAPAIVNAYYSRNKNQIMFPAGILQPPFYHRHFPRSLNYGGIGVVIGHELTHGFDDKGRLFDRHGNIHKWWSDDAIVGFHERARCLVSQYSNYTLAELGIPIDGESTQGENIADNGGIRQAFYAYQNWLQRNRGADVEKSETLPGLSMNSRQLFFLNFAQVWCGAMRPEASRNKLKTAVHSPGKFRVIGTLSNSVEFAREFACPIGSPMNPAHKCSVW